MAAATLNTAPYHGYQVLFSPYSPMKLAFTGAQNYGIAGKAITRHVMTSCSPAHLLCSNGAWLFIMQVLVYLLCLEKIQMDSKMSQGRKFYSNVSHDV